MMAAAMSGGGGSVPAIRCRHHRRANRLPHRSKRWQPTTLLLVILLFALSCGLVLAAINNSAPSERRPLLLYIPMHVSEPLEHLQELCDRTLSKDPWVTGSGREQKDKTDISPLAFDILLVVSGPSDASHNATEHFGAMRSMLEAATENLLPLPPRIFLDYKPVGVDRYNLNLAEEDKDAEWVSGPNSVFYDAFAEGGEIYEKYVRFYALVQQLETDVCALRGGWLSALLRPMLMIDEGGEPESSSESSLKSSLSSPSIDTSPSQLIMSGPTIRSSCMYVVKYDECQPFEGDAPHMTEHVNGNAVYRSGETLQLVLKSAREQFANAEPFDLAIYHVLKASNASSTLAHSNPLYHNTATLLDRDWFFDFRYHGVDDLAVLHAPRRLLADGLKTVATRAQGYLPATTVVLSKESADEQSRGRRTSSSSSSNNTLLNNFKAAADELRLSGVIYIALSEEVFFEASRVVPLQVLPAFERRSDDLILLSSAGRGGEVDYSSSSVVASVSTTAAEAAASAAGAAASIEEEEESAASATAAAATSAFASADPQSFVLTWPPTSPSPVTRLLATIAQLVTHGYSPLVVDAASAPLQNYDMVLYGFRKDAVFFADTSPGVEDEVRRPFSSKTSDDSNTLAVDTMYAPASAFTANFLQAWAVKTLERQQGQERAAAGASAAASASAALVAASTAAGNAKLLSIADLRALAACRLETMSWLTPCPWRGVSVEALPVHWFAPQIAYFGSGWTKRARKHALFLDMSSGGRGGGVGGASSLASPSLSSASSTTTIFRLRQAGKWYAPARCPTFSMLSRHPRDLTHETVFDELALHAEFVSFVRERKIACAVLPGFRVPLTGATLPVDALLDLETIHASAGTQATILPRVQDVEEASSVYVAFDRDRDRQKSKEARSSSSQHSRKQKDLSVDDLCSAFHQIAPPSSTTACFARDISLALNEARSAMPLSSFACALDTRRTVEEVALTGLRGASGLAEVAAKVSKATAVALKSSSFLSPSDAATTLLTGSWRLLPRGSFGNAALMSSSLSSSRVKTLSDLHSYDQNLQCAQALNPKASPLADEAWAGIVEALLCRHSVLSFDVSRQLSSSLLDVGKKSTPRSKATVGHRRNCTFAELVARHIPPTILLEDVTAFARWLARPDRPNLVRGRSLQFLLAGEGGGGVGGGGKKQLSSRESSSSSISSASASANKTPSSSSSSRHKAALQSLSMLAPTIAETRADYAFLPAAADATTGNLLPWSSVTEIGELYRARPTLLPPSLAAMMHPKAVLEFLLSPGSSTLPLNVVAIEAGGAVQKEDIANTVDHLSQDAAFRTTVAALGRMKRREAALLKLTKKKLWALPPAAAAGHQQSREAALSVSSMGASDDVVVRLSVGTG